MKSGLFFLCFVFFLSPLKQRLNSVPLCFLLQVLFHLYRQAKYIPFVAKKYFSVCILCGLMLLKVKEVAMF